MFIQARGKVCDNIQQTIIHLHGSQGRNCLESEKSYGCQFVSSLRDIEKYDLEGGIPTRIIILDTDPNTKDIDKIGLDMLYQSDISEYIKRSKEFKKNLRKS